LPVITIASAAKPENIRPHKKVGFVLLKFVSGKRPLRLTIRFQTRF